MGGNTRKNPMDLSGQKFGSLIIIKKSDKKYRNAFLWECRCDCGAICHVQNGRNSSQTKLGFDEVLEIKKLLVSNKLRSKEIAKRFCATLAMVSQIKRNVTWKDVPWPIGGINGECKRQ